MYTCRFRTSSCYSHTQVTVYRSNTPGTVHNAWKEADKAVQVQIIPSNKYMYPKAHKLMKMCYTL